MEETNLETLVCRVYPEAEILQSKNLSGMKLKMSRTGAFSWQFFRNVWMVETDTAYIFDIRDSLVRGQKKGLILSGIFLPLSLVLITSGVNPGLFFFSLPLLVLSFFGCIVCSVNMVLFRRLSRIILIGKDSIPVKSSEKDWYILRGKLRHGDRFSIVADMKEVRNSGRIAYDADYTIHFRF